MIIVLDGILETTRAQLLKHGASPAFVESYLAMSQAPDASEDDAAKLSNAVTLETFVNQIIRKLFRC